MSIHERDTYDKTCLILLLQLKGLLAGEDLSQTSAADRRHQVNKVMTELQQRRRLGWVKIRGGKILHDPVSVACALVEHWTGLCQPGQKSEEECLAFFRGQNLPPNFSTMAKALYRPLTPELVGAALAHLHNNVSPEEMGLGPSSTKPFLNSLFQKCMIWPRKLLLWADLRGLGARNHQLHSQKHGHGLHQQTTAHCTTRC